MLFFMTIASMQVILACSSTLTLVFLSSELMFNILRNAGEYLAKNFRCIKKQIRWSGYLFLIISPLARSEWH